MLEVLARRGLPATFFVVAEKLRDLPRRTLAERALAEEGAAFTAEFPAACLALREGCLLCDPATISREDHQT